MLNFQGLYPYRYHANETTITPHIHPLTNISLTKLQRGSLSESLLDSPSGILFQYDYVPPPLELYTQFSLQTHFFAFWGILVLQTCTILVIDKICIKNIPNATTLWDRVLHSVQKSTL